MEIPLRINIIMEEIYYQQCCPILENFLTVGNKDLQGEIQLPLMGHEINFPQDHLLRTTSHRNNS